MKSMAWLVALVVLSANAVADSPALVASSKKMAPPPTAILSVREARYDGKLSDNEARFVVDIDAESIGKGEATAKLFEGDVAVLAPKLSDQLRIVREGNRYLLTATHPGRFKFKLELVAKIQRAEPWNQISFAGPSVAIASVTAQASGAGMEVQLLGGTLLESAQTNGLSRVKGFLGADQTIALRWQGKVAEVARKALITVDTTASAQVTPMVIKYTTQLRYDLVQGNAARLTLSLPAAQALTRLVGEQIRDWQIKAEGDQQILTIEFIKPIEKQYSVTLFSEQTVETTPATARLNPPQPLGIERESGAFTLTAEDTLVEIDSITGLRQVNATGGALASYRFNGRPFTLALRLKRIEPVINVADRVTTQLEETRLLISHNLELNVEKAGIYALELSPQAGFVVAEVRGEGIEDWKMSDGKLRVNFSARILGPRKLNVQLEQALKVVPEQIVVTPLRVMGAAKETAQIGAASAAGIRLKTAELSGLREIPVNRLPNRTDELLAFTTEQPDWKISLASERLPARIVAEILNLVTIGDGLVGGSATIRYGLINQGVQEFKVQLPPHCKNIEFTGPNIRRKELSGEIWTIGLQDKVWGGYTLVVTYDYQFDPKGATLPVGGIHALDVERETGSIAVTTAASLKLNAKPASDPLRRVDEFELASGDRALITRSVLLAYQYTGTKYDLTIDVQRHDELPVLEAVADRTQITSVLTEAGEMLTQASFMVKNNEKQFQKFQLPAGANLWGCYVNGQPAKPERDGEWVLVSLPRDVNRDQAFAVDIVYAEKTAALKSSWGQPLRLTAPKTDVPNTYAEWQLYVPASQRLSRFGGSMSVAQGTTYEALDAWRKFLTFYGEVIREAGPAAAVMGILAFLVIALVISAVRRGWNGLLTVLVVFAILAILAGMMLPALSKAKQKSQRISGVNNLKQIALAARIFAGDNDNRLPASFEEMMNELGTDKIVVDPESGQRFIYVGAGYSLGNLTPDSVLAYSPIDNGRRSVAFADGSVSQLSSAQFSELSQRGLVRVIPQDEVGRREQLDVVAQKQFQPPRTIPTRRLQAENKPALTEAPAPSRPMRFEAGLETAAGRSDGFTTNGVADSSAIIPRVTSSAGGSGGSGGASGPVAATATPAPTVAGLRSIRIEIPRTGNSFLFTKILNVRDEPLSVQAKMMSVHTFQAMQMTGQVAAFVLGLVAWWWQWRKQERNSFVLTLALALIIASVCSLLIAWRALHDLLIIGFPCVVLGTISYLVWKYWPRRKMQETTAPLARPEGGIPPAIASILLAGFFAFANVAIANETTNAVQNAIPSVIPIPSANISIVSANYSGVVSDRVAQLEATLQLSSTKPDQTISLFGEDVAVQQFTVKSGDANLFREGKNIAVRFSKRGAVTVQIKLLVKLGGDVTKRHLTFGIPPALSSQLALTLDQADADVDFPTAISLKRSSANEKTRVEAVIGSGDRVELLWTPRVKRAAEVAATIFCQNTALITFGGGVVNARATLDFQVTQGELRNVRVQLPAGQRLLRVEGDAIRTWEIKEENGGQILVVELLKGISPAYRLTVETEKVLETLPATVKIETPHALDVKRETGLAALRGAEELVLSVESAKELQRVDAEEFARVSLQKNDGLLSVFRFLKPEFDLRVRAETVRPQVEALVRNNVRVSADQVNIHTVIDYTIKRAGVFALTTVLPAGYRVEQVAGTNILQWNERTEGEARLLEVTLKERTLGAYSLQIELAKSFKDLPKSLAIAGVHPLDTVKLTGFISVAAEPGVATKSETFDGLTEIPATSLPDLAKLSSAGSTLAYKFIATEPKSTASWKLSVTTETVEPWLRAEIVNTVTLTESLISGRALVRYDIANAPVKELRLKIPGSFKNVEISGVNIRRRDQTGEEWRVELQSKTRGFYTLTVTWEQPRAAKTNLLELIGVSAAGVERETGLIAIIAKPPLQVSERDAKDLKRVDTRDFPEWAGRADDATVLAYRYVRPGYALTLEARRFDEAEILQALVDSVRLTTVVAEDGQTMTEMNLELRNNGRQFLEVELPQGTTVWSAFVAGQPVRPSRRDGKLLLPLEQSGADNAPVSVELTYVGTNTFPKTRGAVGFVSPKLDVPLKGARWELFLPPDFDYNKFVGTMTREIPSMKISLASFGWSEYAQKENDNKAASKAEAKKDVSKAKLNLSSGNLREAAADYNRARAKQYGNRAGEGENADVKQLEKELQVAQGSNLINAQSNFSSRNNVSINEPVQNFSGKFVAQYNNDDAERQWMKLQQAQEIVAAKVQPLHVNLPARGLRYTFTQVLQTEVNKPMTIQLEAANTKTGHWLSRTGLSVAGFLILWMAVAFVTARRSDRSR